MKLRNFMYATMIACAFASCSKDDVIENGPDAVQGVADLTIGASVKETKAPTASEIQSEAEKTITTLQVYVYNEAGSTLLGSGYTANYNAATGITISNIPVGGKVLCKAVANMGTVTEAELSSKVIQITTTAGLAADNLPMAGEGVSTSALVSSNAANAATVNTVTIEMERKIARIDLVDVCIGMGNQTDLESGTASFLFEGTFLKNAANKAKLGGAAFAQEEGAVSYFAGIAGITSNTEATYYNLTAKAGQNAGSQLFTQVTTATDLVDVPSLVGTGDGADASFYVLTNGAVTPTTLVLKGKFGITNGVDASGNSTTYAPVTGYYNIPVGIVADNNTFTGGSSATNGIVANKLYRITAIVAGPGDGTPTGDKKAFIKILTEVKDWDVVNQSSVIK